MTPTIPARARVRVGPRANLRVTALILVKARDVGIKVSAEANLMKRGGLSLNTFQV